MATAELDSHSRVVDLGCGTGAFAKLLAAREPSVVAVEPNAAMLEHARGAGLRLVRATAEATGLADATCDLATAAQAFHWFAPRETVAEICRIARQVPRLALVWNQGSTGRRWRCS